MSAYHRHSPSPDPGAYELWRVQRQRDETASHPTFGYGSAFSPNPRVAGIYRPYKSPGEVVVAAARLIFSSFASQGKGGIAKRWANHAAVQEITAKKWLSGLVPERRLEKLADSLLTELESTRARLDEIETALKEIACRGK